MCEMFFLIMYVFSANQLLFMNPLMNTRTKLKKSEPDTPNRRRVRISSSLLLWLLSKWSPCSQRIQTERSEKKEEV